jgi:hypothetical protein
LPLYQEPRVIAETVIIECVVVTNNDRNLLFTAAKLDLLELTSLKRCYNRNCCKGCGRYRQWCCLVIPLPHRRRTTARRSERTAVTDPGGYYGN